MGTLWREIVHEVRRIQLLAGRLQGASGSTLEDEPEPERPIDTLDSIRSDLGDCRRCPLAATRHKIVFGSGSSEANLVIVGEAPGEHEDLEGEPFVGAAGALLDKMVQTVLGLSRQDVYIVNALKCRPPRNRDPFPEEREACIPFLERQVLAIEPKVILVLGSVAHRALFQVPDGILRVRGEWKSWHDIPTMCTFHPSYLLRSPEHKRLAWQDLIEVKSRLQGA